MSAEGFPPQGPASLLLFLGELSRAMKGVQTTERVACECWVFTSPLAMLSKQKVGVAGYITQGIHSQGNQSEMCSTLFLQQSTVGLNFQAVIAVTFALIHPDCVFSFYCLTFPAVSFALPEIRSHINNIQPRFCVNVHFSKCQVLV